MLSDFSEFSQRPHKEQNVGPDRLASARKRLQGQENYQESQNGLYNFVFTFRFSYLWNLIINVIVITVIMSKLADATILGSAYSNRTSFIWRVDLWQNIKTRVLVENASTDVVEPNGWDRGLGSECNARSARSLRKEVMLDFEHSVIRLTSPQRGSATAEGEIGEGPVSAMEGQSQETIDASLERLMPLADDN
ncbi:hypothetical protein Tco_0290959 [Tanacetum coccineum]